MVYVRSGQLSARHQLMLETLWNRHERARMGLLARG